MPYGFKELIGTKSDMESLKSFIEQVRDHTTVDKTSVTLSGLKDLIKDELSELRTEIVLYLLCKNSDKELDLVIETAVFDKEYLKADKKGSISAGFRKYGFDLRVESGGEKLFKGLGVANKNPK